MSTTVSYNGSTIATVENQTKTLLTADSWLLDDITITDTSSGGGDDGSLKAIIERTATMPTLPSNLTKIGAYAFDSCENLALSSLPSGVTSIENYAFSNCFALALTSIPAGVTTIGNYAFSGCGNLLLGNLPGSLTRIGDYAFASCTAVTFTSIPNGVSYIGQYAFRSCSLITISVIPTLVTALNNYAFSGCTGIESITAEGAISSMGTAVFTGRSGSLNPQLRTAYFPNSVSTNSGTMFGSTTATYACKLLEEVDLGSTKQIIANAFANCQKLQTLVLRRSDAICSLANVSAFLSTPLRGYGSLTATVYVPSALISTYQTATNWSSIYNEGYLTFAAIEGSKWEL